MEPARERIFPTQGRGSLEGGARSYGQLPAEAVSACGARHAGLGLGRRSSGSARRNACVAVPGSTRLGWGTCSSPWDGVPVSVCGQRRGLEGLVAWRGVGAPAVWRAGDTGSCGSHPLRPPALRSRVRKAGGCCSLPTLGALVAVLVRRLLGAETGCAGGKPLNCKSPLPSRQDPRVTHYMLGRRGLGGRGTPAAVGPAGPVVCKTSPCPEGSASAGRAAPCASRRPAAPTQDPGSVETADLQQPEVGQVPSVGVSAVCRLLGMCCVSDWAGVRAGPLFSRLLAESRAVGSPPAPRSKLRGVSAQLTQKLRWAPPGELCLGSRGRFPSLVGEDFSKDRHGEPLALELDTGPSGTASLFLAPLLTKGCEDPSPECPLKCSMVQEGRVWRVLRGEEEIGCGSSFVGSALRAAGAHIHFVQVDEAVDSNWWYYQIRMTLKVSSRTPHRLSASIAGQTEDSRHEKVGEKGKIDEAVGLAGRYIPGHSLGSVKLALVTMERGRNENSRASRGSWSSPVSKQTPKLEVQPGGAGVPRSRPRSPNGLSHSGVCSCQVTGEFSPWKPEEDRLLGQSGPHRTHVPATLRLLYPPHSRRVTGPQGCS
ncbi:hypothetical protein J0S82_019237 [Galemys pyrenaicus]|uniref:Uncharacterized protein n=1 Tax=Galemys pyrenaicus TaxID=202257 RepID=A0A8J6ABR2_GALPY|nr:hypothetical protein J0S82_019237 [Galemys pyrenaicus]